MTKHCSLAFALVVALGIVTPAFSQERPSEFTGVVFGLNDLAFAPTIAVMQQPVVIGPTEAIGFDYIDAEFQSSQVARFEASYDGGNWSTLGIPPIAAVIGGVTTYRVIPPQPSGTHTVVFRACNAAGCGGGSSPFAFEPLGAPTTSPSNVRKIPR